MVGKAARAASGAVFETDGAPAYFERCNPLSGAVVSRAPALGPSGAVAAANRAAGAFPAWSRTAPGERRVILDRAATLVARWAPDLRAAMQDEIGATKHWIDFNLEVGRRHIESAADLVTRIEGTLTRDPDRVSFAFREPVGVCLAMAPWNAPFVLGIRSVVTALACGNCVVMKASEICPATHQMIGSLFADAGLPEDVLTVVTHAPEEAEEVTHALIAHDAIRRVNFTGSTRVGRIVAAVAARHLKRCLLELGSKAPLVVLADADLDAAADAAAYGAFINQGQVCMATDRVVVVDAVAEAFVAKLCARAERLRAGDPRSGAALGPLVSEAVAARLTDLIGDAIDKGARLRAGGGLRGACLDATVLDDVTPGMAIYAEECFGPVASVCRAATEAEAIGIANDTSYGLTAAVFSRDTARALAIARQIESGICHVNAPTLYDTPEAPIGGVKDSGYGRFGGMAAIDEFTDLRWVSLPTAPPAYPFLTGQD